MEASDKRSKSDSKKKFFSHMINLDKTRKRTVWEKEGISGKDGWTKEGDG
jgi:hypothetical protein